jgi:hypothetical protein
MPWRGTSALVADRRNWSHVALLIPEFRTATAIAVVIVAIELLVISWIRKRYTDAISPRRISSDRGRSLGISSWDLDRRLVTIEIGNWELLQSWNESRCGPCAFASPRAGPGQTRFTIPCDLGHKYQSTLHNSEWVG